MSNDIEIDYSSIPNSAIKLDEDWDPPVHVHFGRKLENGKREKEPVYVHQEYPRMVYAKPADKIIAKIVNSDDELKALGEGWEKSPAAFGLITCPSFEQIEEMKAQKLSPEKDSKEELITKAKELGIDVKGNWGIPKLTEEIAKVEALKEAA